MIARMVHYTGDVQGVGFRYTAVSIARACPVAGWVRNLGDGRVQLFVEGSEADVETCLKAIRDYWGESISDEQIGEHPPEGLARFEIRR
jgi:acylphosphatase